jgi:spore germination cell wall hydrolase CwlJ-like protein
MTRNIPAKVLDGAQFAKIMKSFTFSVFMIIALTLSGSVLTWAVSSKLEASQIVEHNEITTKIRDRQLSCLARNIYYEAGNEPFEGKVAVAQVTMNRTTNSEFPNDVCQVVYQKDIIYKKVLCQFSWYCDRPSHIKPLNKAAFEESMTVAKKVLLEEFRLPGLSEAMYYHADRVHPGWRKERITTIGHHIFYK